MRPHEEELAIRFNGGNTCLTAEGHGIVAYVPKAEWQPLFLAAPDMAREILNALRVLESSDHADECPSGGDGEGKCECLKGALESGFLQVLRKAGVLP